MAKYIMLLEITLSEPPGLKVLAVTLFTFLVPLLLHLHYILVFTSSFDELILKWKGR